MEHRRSGGTMTTVVAPESTAARVALWRALHLEVDAAPPVLDDRIGLALLAPEEDWRARPDMHPEWTSGFRASIVARARFIEDLVSEQAHRGVDQYVLLGAGLDTLAQRRPDLGARMRVFEVDQPGPQEWKRRRLLDVDGAIAPWLRLVPVDFEADDDWYELLVGAGFDTAAPAVVASTGVSMYLAKETTCAMLERVAGLAPGSTLAMTFMLPMERLDQADRGGLEAARDGARASGTPFVSFYAPEEMLALAADAGFRRVEHVSGSQLGDRYFADRTDGLRPSTGEDLLLAFT
jgi:methyltransferase (TIGR00027 family)